MRRIDGNSETKTKLRLILAVLILAAARVYGQEQASQSARQIVISIPDRKLALIENGTVTKVFSVAVGKAATPSPSGSFKIVTRITDPTYYAPGKIVEPGPLNPLGTRWIGLSQKGYGIHGTNAPKSIGKAASHGCIRMAKKDVEELFKIVRPGDVVEIRAERDELISQVFGSTDEVIVASNETPNQAVESASLAGSH
ncbi:MAG TPA: L,D-transpeptidase [Terriglobales bacterium]|nr:L,D-transpeptidase [Terriglobales bacterium]